MVNAINGGSINLSEEKKKEGLKALQEAIEELKPVVKAIESRIATTKDHYGDYMALISRYPANFRVTFGHILVKAGGNINGIAWALKILGGI